MRSTSALATRDDPYAGQLCQWDGGGVWRVPPRDATGYAAYYRVYRHADLTEPEV
jgi:hypothetical protein